MKEKKQYLHVKIIFYRKRGGKLWELYAFKRPSTVQPKQQAANFLFKIYSSNIAIVSNASRGLIENIIVFTTK